MPPAPLARLLWTRFTWRHWCLAPVQSGTLILLLALGIGVFFAVRLANRAAVASFQNFAELLTAEADGSVVAAAGSLPESVLHELRDALAGEFVELVPVVETTATRPRLSETEGIGERETFQLIGLDLIALQNLAIQKQVDRSWFSQTNGPGATADSEPANTELWARFRDPRSAYISTALARRDQIEVGGTFRSVINDRLIDLRIAGLIPADPQRPLAPPNLIVLDLPALQQITDRPGRLDRVELIVNNSPYRSERWQAIRTKLETVGAARWRVLSREDRQAAGRQMTEAFRLNLTILSLLALVVGLYLVFQALDGAVVRRREEIAILRSLGVRPAEIRAAWLREAAVLGLVGGVVGLLLGWGGAQGAVRLIGRTVNALYYATSVDAAALNWPEAGVAVVLAIATSLLAGWLPARTAAATPPAQVLVRAGTTFAGPTWLRRPAWGIALLALGGLLLPFGPARLVGGGRFTWAAYLTAILWLAGFGILAGKLLEGTANGLRPLGQCRATWRLALSQLLAPSGRHRLALAGLVAAVAMTGGMGILVQSFDTTVRGWIERTFQADIYISSDGAQSASTQNRIRPEIWRALAAHPAVAAANAIQITEIQLPVGSTLLGGSTLSWFRDHTRTTWLAAPADDAVFDPLRNSHLCLVSEAFTERFQLYQGATFTLPTPTGPQRLTIAGVFADYGNERGSISIERTQFAHWFGDEQASSLILALKTGENADRLRAEFRGAHPGLAVYTNAYLRREALRIFRQTFAITYALELIGIVVAVAGLGFTLMSLLLERRAELTTLRALGFTHHEIAATTAWEGLLTAAAGIATGLLLSLALGWLLIQRVNKQTFGWTLETDHPWGQLALLAGLVLTAAGAVGWLVGRRGAKLPAEKEE